MSAERPAISFYFDRQLKAKRKLFRTANTSASNILSLYMSPLGLPTDLLRFEKWADEAQILAGEIAILENIT